MAFLIISKFESILSHKSVTTDLLEELSKIKNGFYESIVTPCRELVSIEDFTGYSILKSKLPALTFSGVFNTQRRHDLLSDYTNVIVLDIDKLEPDELIKIKECLVNDSYTFSCWISPSGRGLKVLVKVDSDASMHKAAFLQLGHYFKVNYNVEVDTSGSDLSRLCFVSHDPLLYVNINSSLFQVSNQLPQSDTNNRSHRPLKIKTDNDRSILYDTKNKNKTRDRYVIQKIILFLKKQKKSITSTYDEWVRVALAISNTFTYDLGQKYFLELSRLDNERHDEEKSIALLNYAYHNKIDNKIMLGTIVFFAGKHGFVLKSTSDFQ